MQNNAKASLLFWGHMLGIGLATIDSTPILASSAGVPVAMSGVPHSNGIDGEGNCTQCHTSFLLNPDEEGHVALLGVPKTYEPGKVYTLIFRITHPNARRWGFQATAVYDNTLKSAGQISSENNDKKTEAIASNIRTYIQHGASGKLATGIGQLKEYEWRFQWKAPVADLENVSFYGYGNASNADGTEMGDKIYGPKKGALAHSKPAKKTQKSADN